jgi:hypothetical protein
LSPIILGCGFLQGNPPSPNQFNIGGQILLFKIELSPDIKSISNDQRIQRPLPVPAPIADPIPVPLAPPLPVPLQEPVPAPIVLSDRNAVREENLRFNNIKLYGTKEKNRETEKLETFADDNTVIALLTERALSAIKDILSDFGNISGLKCNVEKSNLLIIGTDRVPDYATSSDFAVVNSLKILGINITRNFDDLYNNFDTVETKIASTVNFWKRFNLSLIGRINVAKTLLLSQVGYVGCIISPKPEQLKRISSQINDFVTGGFNIKKDDLYLSVKKGGLGMIDLEEFLCGLQCSWIKKCIDNTIDVWRYDLNKDTKYNPIIFSQFSDLAAETGFYLNLGLAWESVKVCFFNTNDNFFRSSLYGNPIFINNRRENLRFDVSLIPDPANHDWERRHSVNFNDLFVRDQILKPKAEIEILLDCELTGDLYEILKIAVQDSTRQSQKKRVEIPSFKIQMLSEFLSSFKKG